MRLAGQCVRLSLPPQDYLQAFGVKKVHSHQSIFIFPYPDRSGMVRTSRPSFNFYYC